MTISIINNIKSLIVIIMMISVYNQINAKEISLFEVGVFGGINLNEHKAGFIELPNIPNCCVPYNDKTSLGYDLGIVAEYSPFSEFTFQIKSGIMSLGTELKSREFIGDAEINSQKVNVYSDHSLTTKIIIGYGEPVIIYKPFQSIPIRFGLGFIGGIFLQKDYIQKETLMSGLTDEGIEYTNRKEFSGKCKELSSAGKIVYYQNFLAINPTNWL